MDTALAHAHQMGTRVLGSERKGRSPAAPRWQENRAAAEDHPACLTLGVAPLGHLLLTL